MYPFWSYLKKFFLDVNAIVGINATAAAIIIANHLGISALNVSLIAATFGILNFTKIPAPLLVVIAIVAGFIV